MGLRPPSGTVLCLRPVPDYLNDYLSTYQFRDNASHSQSNIDGYAQFDWNITPRLNVVASLRYDHFSASSQSALTERLAIVYKFPWMTFRANYASGFRAPTLKEMFMHFDMGNMGYMIIGNPDLKPEKSHNFNLALERTNRIRNSGILDGRYDFTLVGYCNVFDKRITTIDGGDYQGMPSALYWNVADMAGRLQPSVLATLCPRCSPLRPKPG